MTAAILSGLHLLVQSGHAFLLTTRTLRFLRALCPISANLDNTGEFPHLLPKVCVRDFLQSRNPHHLHISSTPSHEGSLRCGLFPGLYGEMKYKLVTPLASQKFQGISLDFSLPGVGQRGKGSFSKTHQVLFISNLIFFPSLQFIQNLLVSRARKTGHNVLFNSFFLDLTHSV